MTLGIESYVWLTAAAMLAGFIDSIAGGGGLITVPALLASGLPPVNALATNKLQSVFSVATAFWRYLRMGLIDVRRYMGVTAFIFVCAMAGAWVLQRIPADALGKVMPVLIICVVAYMVLSPRMTDDDSRARLGLKGYAPVGGAIGFYDGFFGPGAGSFFTTSLVALKGMGLRRAAAHTKLFNLASNAAGVLLFVASGKTLWLLGFIMALGSMSGAWIGSHLAIRHGAKVIRPLLIFVSLALTARLAWQNFGPG
ncbi:TSUP family transporter [Sphingobium sp. CR28]|uniref:TSUP family transporter n=1 Tax=Sphingobium sp. CR28 TaxID=3400272 RepID=UPI003FEEE224